MTTEKEPVMFNDQERLADNQRTLLETMPEPVFLINIDGVFQYMNPAASVFLESSKSNSRKLDICSQLKKIIRSSLENGDVSGPKSIALNGHDYKALIAPFIGYKGDDLFWFIIKNTPLKSKSYGKTKPSSFTPMIGSSQVMRDLQNYISSVAETDSTVMINGESGTGKELVAHLLHKQSLRKDNPFLAINCNTINDTLLESELFGYEKGAFTGAYSRKIGKFEALDGGTIFLDEIGDISPRMQAVLLRVLQNGEIIRVGGSNTIKVNVRIIAATNRNLAEDVQKGNFRLDLFYRLNIIKIALPPLRDRGQDVLELASFFAQKYSDGKESDIRFTDRATKKLLQNYPWPGNVRELENIIQRALLLRKTNTIDAEELSFDMSFIPSPQTTSLSSTIDSFDEEAPLKNIIDLVEKEVIIHKLKNNGGNVAEAAEGLKICKAALYEKMRRHDISAKALR